LIALALLAAPLPPARGHRAQGRRGRQLQRRAASAQLYQARA